MKKQLEMDWYSAQHMPQDSELKSTLPKVKTFST